MADGVKAAPDAGKTAPPAQRAGMQAATEAFFTPPGPAAGLSSLPIAVGLLSTALIIAGLYFGRQILVPLALAFFLGFVLDPFVVRLKRLGIPRPVAVVGVVSLALAAVVGSGFLLTQQARSVSAQLPTYRSNIQHKLRDFRATLSGPGIFDGAVTTFDAVRQVAEEQAGTSGPTRRRAEPQLVRVQEAPASPLDRASRWLGAVGGPLTQAGIVLVFVVVILLDRQDLRDRLLRLLGGNLHRTTDALDEAGHRISKYLLMQLVVNATYGIPMAIGLWFIGVPGAVLWGALAAVMRFVPYLGPMISAVFPLVLAFAVDPGWDMLLWTGALILFLELVSNNLVEPWLYGASTGLSAMSVIVAATFWALLWGPVGLVISTPLTVCLLVIGRHLPQLRFFAVALGSQPVLDPATRIYQRLLAGDVEEAIELSLEQVQSVGLTPFYGDVGIPMLRIASADHDRVATAAHRLRIVDGAERVINELGDGSAASATGSPQVICLGAKWELDVLAARMLAHALAEAGVSAEVQSIDPAAADFVTQLDLRGARIVCLSHFSPTPGTRIRYLCRHLRRHWPDLKIVAALWNAPPDLLDAANARSIGVDDLAPTFEEVIARIQGLLDAQLQQRYLPAPIPDGDVERVRLMRASGALDDDVRRHFDRIAHRAAEVFDAPIGLVTLIDEASQLVCGAGSAGSGVATPLALTEAFHLPRDLSLCGHVVASTRALVVADIARDPRFANNPALAAQGVRFYAGAPFGDASGNVFGALCIVDHKPRAFSASDLRLLQSMADDLRTFLREQRTAPAADSAGEPAQDVSSATVAQPVPG